MAEEKIYISTHTGLEIDRAVTLTSNLDDRLEAQELAVATHTEEIHRLQDSLINEEIIDQKIKNAIDTAILDVIGGTY